MSSNAEQSAKTAQDQEQNDQQSHKEWETMARAWLSSFPEAKEVSMAEVEAWIDSNLASLPPGLRSMPRPDLCLRLISIQNCMRFPTPQESAKQVDPSHAQVDPSHAQVDPSHARFQRSGQWLPVYSWLETLDKDEVVNSKEITDWLIENPEGLEQPVKDTSLKAQQYVMEHRAPLPSRSVNKLPKDSDLYLAKRNEAYRKYQIDQEFIRSYTGNNLFACEVVYIYHPSQTLLGWSLLSVLEKGESDAKVRFTTPLGGSLDYVLEIYHASVYLTMFRFQFGGVGEAAFPSILEET
ncbi:hypothetical protein TanjilG_14616 [Lupinus angustifolius]|uniref:Uncharacterized protein n=1 Tax=Lupinus angustifolius TaxID=3871 RepID=A0A1J7G9P3_LUPAN|nr:hypothetical protein TanjilG_14616 [Lupinus angustifolius]